MSFCVILSSVQAVGKAAVVAYVQKLLSGKPSGVLLGDQALLPKFDAVTRRLGHSLESVVVCPPAVLSKFDAAACRFGSWRRFAMHSSALESVLLSRRPVCGELAATAVMCLPTRELRM